MLSVYDYIVIGFYFVFVMSLGFVFKKFNKGSKDYFAGGQRMCWWLLGGSLFISNFSCWTFTGAAGIAHKYGILIMYVYLMDVLGYIIGYLFFATRLRQMRLITAIDGVRRRFGKVSEQFFNWLGIIGAPMWGGVWLFGLAMILTSVFVNNNDLESKPNNIKVFAIVSYIDSQKTTENVEKNKAKVGGDLNTFETIKKEFEAKQAISQRQWISLLKTTLVLSKYMPALQSNAKTNGYASNLTEITEKQNNLSLKRNWIIIITGITVLVMAMLGGNWAVAASDFIQLLLLLSITVVTAFLAISEVGGVGAFYEQLPKDFFTILYPLGSIKYDWLFLISMIAGSILLRNNIMTAAKYISAKDSKHAKRSALVPLIGYAVLPLLWFIPVWAAPTIVPNLMTDFKGVVNNPEEMSYIVIAMKILPQGLLGLLVVGLFAATMSSMDTAFNKNAGYIVCNFYRDILRPKASDKELYLAGMVATAVSGACVIAVAWVLANLGTISVFDSYLYFSAFIGPGGAIAFLLGMFVKKTPPWAAWVTALFSIVVSFVLFAVLRWDSTAQVLRPLLAGTFLANIYEYILSNPFFMTNMIVIPLCVGVFFLSKSFYNPQKNQKYEKQVGELFMDMKTPVDFGKELGVENDNSKQQAKTLGILSLVYGAFIMLMIFIPNPLSGRIAIFGCSFIMLLVGGLLVFSSRKIKIKQEI